MYIHEETYYIAWDDSEFNDYNECLRYENQCLEKLKNINDCCVFIDKNNVVLEAPKTEILDDWVQWLDGMYEDDCEFIQVNKPLSNDIINFIKKEWSFITITNMDNQTVGLFKYNRNTEEWVKVSE